jgi:hypothetical protein
LVAVLQQKFELARRTSVFHRHGVRLVMCRLHSIQVLGVQQCSACPIIVVETVVWHQEAPRRCFSIGEDLLEEISTQLAFDGYMIGA